MITAFTDNFYSDYDADNETDTDGTTIYGITISDSSLGFVNGELVTMMANRTTQDDIIPVYITDTEAEAAFEEEFVAKGMDLEPTIFTDKQTALDNVVIRYQRFFIEEQSLTYDDVDYDTLGYAEGLMIQVDDSVYGIEKNMKTSVYSVSLMEWFFYPPIPSIISFYLLNKKVLKKVLYNFYHFSSGVSEVKG